MDDHDKEKRREQIVFMCSGKFEAQVTNNRRLQSMVCTIEAADRHEAACGLLRQQGYLLRIGIMAVQGC